jgi:secreted trypsin-like serine protease
MLELFQGDSGGPLFVRSTPGSPWIQAGIVSFGLGELIQTITFNYTVSYQYFI